MRQKQVHMCIILFSLTTTRSKIAPAGRINRDLLQNKLQAARGDSRKEKKEKNFGASQLKKRDITEKDMIGMFNIIDGTKMVS